MSYNLHPCPGGSPGPEMLQQQDIPPQGGPFAMPCNANGFNASWYTNMPPTMTAHGHYPNAPVFPGNAPWGSYYNTPQMGGGGWPQAQVLQPMQHGFEDSQLYNGWVGVRGENEIDENDKGKGKAKKDKKNSKKNKKSKQVNNNAQSPGNALPGAYPVSDQAAPSVVHQANVGKKNSSKHYQAPHADDNLDDDSSLGRKNGASSRATPVSEVHLHPGGSGRIIVRCETTTQPGNNSNASVSDQRRGGHTFRGHESDSGTDTTDTDTDTDTDSDTPESSPSRVVRSPPATMHAAAAGDARAGTEIVPVPAITAFAVSARRMRQTARNWSRFCGSSSGFGGFGGPSNFGGYIDACNLTVRDAAAVLGLYRMLEVLHTGVTVSQAAIRKSSSLAWSSSTPPPPAFPNLPPAPVVLPPRVLAYVVMFGIEFGALDVNMGTSNSDAKKQQQQNQQQKQLMPPPHSGSMQQQHHHQHHHQQAQNQNQPPPLPNLLRTRIAGWLDAFAYSVGSTSKGKTPATPATENTGPLARDWPYVLYVARVLGHRALFAACVRLLLEHWGPLVEDEGVGAARLAELAPTMQGVVIRDMGSLRATRMQAVETIVGQALQTFPPSSM